MKVLLINGSPHPRGTTYAALSEAENQFNREGIETELMHIGAGPIQPCTGCSSCKKTGLCVFDDAVRTAQQRMRESDGLIIGAPVYYASPNGGMIAFLDRMFYSGARAGFAFKPGAAVAVARRAGTTAALDVLNKYFTVSGMPIVSSQYWNMVFGEDAPDAANDLEGLQTMRVLASNMAWLIRCIQAGRDAGVPDPLAEPRARTNFIRK